MKPFSIFLFLWLGASLTASDGAAMLADSAHWPARVRLLEPVLEANPTAPDPSTRLPAGARGVLIRAEPATGDLVVDFGRRGHHRVRPEATDFAAGYARLVSGEDVKERPNYLNMIAPRLTLRAGERFVRWAVDDAAVAAARGFLFLYTDASDEALDALGARYRPLASAIRDRGYLPVLLPLQSVPHEALFDRARARGIEAVVLYQFLVEGYIHALAHLPERSPRWVLVDLDGKILAEGEAADIARIVTLTQ